AVHPLTVHCLPPLPRHFEKVPRQSISILDFTPHFALVVGRFEGDFDLHETLTSCFISPASGRRLASARPQLCHPLNGFHHPVRNSNLIQSETVLSHCVGVATEGDSGILEMNACLFRLRHRRATQV